MTTKPYKPAGYPSVSPYIVVEKAQLVIDFASAVFDARPLRRHNRPDGSIMHAEMMIDDTVVMVADCGAVASAHPAVLHVYVPDVDATYQRALEAGGTSLQKPVQQGDADKRGGVKDPAGNDWWFGTQIGEHAAV